MKQFLVTLKSQNGTRLVTLRVNASSHASAFRLGEQVIQALTPIIEAHYAKNSSVAQEPLKMTPKVVPFEDTGTR